MSGSGKTTLAERIVAETGAALLRTDDYYRPFDHLGFDERSQINFDHPDSVDGELLAEHVRWLRRGVAVEAPRYDFANHTRAVGGRTVEPRPLIVIEGIFPLCYPALIVQTALTVFVATDPDLCLDRRIRRDVSERGRDADEVVYRWRHHVQPSFDRYVRPALRQADLVVKGERALDEILEALGTSAPAVV